MRSSMLIKKDLDVLEQEHSAAVEIEQHNQLIGLIHDELDDCKDVDALRKYIKASIIPILHPAPTESGK